MGAAVVGWVGGVKYVEGCQAASVAVEGFVVVFHELLSDAFEVCWVVWSAHMFADEAGG